MTAKIDTSEYIPEELAALGKQYIRKMQRGNSAMWSAGVMNQTTYKAWRNHLFELALSSFEWEGLPPEIDPRYIEYILIKRGCGGFFALHRGTAQWGFCPATPRGKLTMYMNPNEIQLTPPTGGEPWYRHAYYFVIDNILHKPDAALCWDRKSRAPFMPVIELFARRLAAIDRTVDVNIMAQQTPYVVTTNENGRRDAENLMMSILGHSAVLSIDERAVDSFGVNVLNTNAPYVADKLLVDQSKIVNTFLTMCGIDNTNTEKRERMIDAEATSNNENIMLVRNSRLRCREDFCMRIAELTDGLYTPTVKYSVPYQLDGSVNMGGGTV